jgi:hypothetical protein
MLLAVAILPSIIVAPLFLEDDDLVSLGLRDDFGSNLNFAAIAGKQDIAQRHGVTGFSCHLFDDNLVSCGNAILLAARAHNCEHGFDLFSKV